MPADAVDLNALLDAFQRIADLAGQDRQSAPADPLEVRLTAHLGSDPRTLPCVAEQISPLRLTDADVALEVVSAAHGGAEIIGAGGGDQRWHQSLSDLAQQFRWSDPGVAPPEYRLVAVGPHSERRIVAWGLHLLTYRGEPLVVMQRAQHPQFGADARLEVMGGDQETIATFLEEIRAAMTAHSVLRGQVVAFDSSPYEAGSEGVRFLERPTITEQDVILPAGLLDRVSRHVLGIGQRSAELRARGQHLKRGVLLYGAPGTGKTLTVRHLVGRTDATVIMLSGMALHGVGLAVATARALAPAIVVLEDCDLVAEERSNSSMNPLLFEVLDALDGLASDADITFLMTTNRVDVLEPALAQRPGRVDLAVEVPKPDLTARRALLDLYAPVGAFTSEALDGAARATEGTTASFGRELVRRAVLLAVENGQEPQDADLATVLEELLADSERITRAMLGAMEA